VRIACAEAGGVIPAGYATALKQMVLEAIAGNVHALRKANGVRSLIGAAASFAVPK